MRQKLIKIATIISGYCVVAVVILYVVSLFVGLNCFWSMPGTRYDLTVERGSLLLCQLHNYRFDTPFRWGYYTPETAEQFESFKKWPAWWHGDNSWWERIGYTVKSRVRFLGFEWATGEYWPPFIWQHPRVPFTVYQIPVWAVVLLFAALPLIRVIALLNPRPASNSSQSMYSQQHLA